MNTSDIVLAIDAEIAQLQKVKVLLTGTDLMSAEGRAKIAAAQKARWAKSKRVAKKAARKAASIPAKKAVTAVA